MAATSREVAGPGMQAYLKKTQCFGVPCVHFEKFHMFNFKHFYLKTSTLYDTFSLYLPIQKMKFSTKDFFSKCDQIRKKLRILSHLLKKFFMENFIFCALSPIRMTFFVSFALFLCKPTILNKIIGTLKQNYNCCFTVKTQKTKERN